MVRLVVVATVVVVMVVMPVQVVAAGWLRWLARGQGGHRRREST